MMIYINIYYIISTFIYYILFVVGTVEISCWNGNDEYVECDAGGVVTNVGVKRQDSQTTCVKEENFGASGSNIWVKDGCR